MDSLRWFLPVLLLIPAPAFGADPLEVHTKSGPVRGKTVTPIKGKSAQAFLGIPYGAPTGGRNRFSPPKEAEPWNVVFDATEFSKPCFQVADKALKLASSAWWLSDKDESEDCLKLNIWVPTPRSKKAAVMVWFHGGAFSGGSSDIPMYNGATLAAHEDVVVVSANYRLSVFGFLYLAHPMAPGNVGMMDQTLALKWVQKNIEVFGGNPKRVTVFGQSAGGASAAFHTLSPASLDLFQNAILISGTMNAIWGSSTPELAMSKGMEFAERAGCPMQKDNVEDGIRCLQELSAEKILEAGLVSDGVLLDLSFRPVVDGKYLSARPSKLLEEGKFCGEKNVMFGYTREDGSFILPVFVPQMARGEGSEFSEDHLKELITKVSVVAGEISGLPVELARFVYSDWESANSSTTISRMVHFLTDRWFACGSTVAADLMADKGNKVFFYRFDHETPSKPPSAERPSWIGCGHGDDLDFVFGHFLKKESLPEDIRLTKQMMRYFANFAKKGDPNDDYLPAWPKYTSRDKLWLQIDGEATTVNKASRIKECHFWEKIFPKLQDSSRNEVR